MDLTSNGTTAAVARQAIAHTSDDVQHVLAFEVTAGEVSMRVGTTAGGDEILGAETFEVGWHLRDFTPPVSNATFYLEFQNVVSGAATIDNVRLLDDEAVEIPTPYACEDLRELAFTQSADILFLTHKDYAPRKLLRYGHSAWSLQPLVFKPSVATRRALRRCSPERRPPHLEIRRDRRNQRRRVRAHCSGLGHRCGRFE
jgi:hypothetical protein